jgi:putative oxidoreductase
MYRQFEAQLDRLSAPVLGLFRIVVGFLFALHGTVKLFGWPELAKGGGAVPFGTWPNWWAGVIELVVGLLLMVGLFTRPAALLGSGTMAFAYFTVHQPKALLPIDNGGELAVLYCFAFLLIAFAGPGIPAIDGRRSQD